MTEPTNEVPQESAPEQPPAPALEPEPPLSLAGDLAGVIVAPGATFRGIVNRRWWYALVPLAIMLVFNVVSSSLFMSKVDMGQLVRDQIRQSKFASQMSQSQIDEAAERAANRPKWITVAVGAVGLPVVVLIMALVFWLVLLAFGKDVTYGRSFQATSWAMLPMVFSAVVFLVMLFVKDANAINVNNPLMTNPAAFFEPDAIPKPLYALLSAIDIFKIWIIALMGIGLAAAARCKVSQATLTVASLYGFWVLVKVGLAAIF